MICTILMSFPGFFFPLKRGVNPKFNLELLIFLTIEFKKEERMEVPEEIRSRYMERRKRDLEQCLNSLQTSNYVEIEKVGHQLKGNGLTFGYADLSQIGKQLEKAASKKDIPSVESALKEFSEWVNQHLN
jgi:hypothetical protein